MKFNIKTFGCQMNVCDSFWLEKALVLRGWEPVPESEADVFLVNTCSVREKPEQKVYSLLGRLREHISRKEHAFVGVGGCVAQQIGKSIWNRFPEVRLVYGTDGLVYVPDALESLATETGKRISLLEFEEYYPEREKLWPKISLPSQAYVNIMQGCDNFCAYCVVPFTRGRQKSRMSHCVLEECQELVQGGVKEITLLGQNVNSYGQDSFGDGVSFSALLDKVCQISGLARVHFTTSHPKDISKGVIESFGRYSNLCPHLHLPLQSGSNRVLSKMGRKYTREHYLDIVRQLRSVRPEITISTDIIVGFPGETYDDFLKTLDLMQRVRFDWSYSFKYSDRPFVRAARFSNKLPEEVKSVRLQALQQLQEETTLKSMQGMLEKEVTVLVEGPSSWNNGSFPLWRGREPGGRVVNFKWVEKENIEGTFIKVKITQAKKHSLFGEGVKLL